MTDFCNVFSVPSSKTVIFQLEKEVCAMYQADEYRFRLYESEGFCLEEIRTRSGLGAAWNLQISYKEVVKALKCNVESGVGDALQKKLLSMLEHQNIWLLSKHGYGLYSMATMSRYIGNDYPYVYWLVLLVNPRWIPAEVGAVISRELLAESLGVKHLSNGQMKAIRKLLVSSGVNIRDLQTAILMIARNWDVVRPLVSHKALIDSCALSQGTMLLTLSPELRHSRWFCLENLAMWESRFDKYAHPTIYFKYAMLVAKGKTVSNKQDFLRLDEDFMTVISGMAIDDVDPAVGRAALEKSLIDYGGGMVAMFPAEVSMEWERRWRRIVHEYFMDVDDDVYNMQEKSDLFIDEEEFSALSGMDGDGFFSRVTTAGQLRNIALLLDNCAASRVHLCVGKKSEFWFYSDKATNEKALLQVNVNASQNKNLLLTVVEFNGYKNLGVSPQAEKRLYSWKKSQETLHESVIWSVM
jgi:hypothetical protein